MTLLRRLRRLLAAELGSRPGGTAGRRRPGDARPDPGPRSRAGPSAGDPTGRDPELARYYANLEVPYGADLETVRSAWKELLRKYHPDLHSTQPEKRRIATELVQGLNRAYAELSSRLGKNR